MNFLNPAFLFGLSAAALPVAIHLFSRKKRKSIRWAATRFLAASVKKNQRHLQMDDLLLLALRCLLFGLFAFAFARPFFGAPPSAAPVSTEGPATHVLIVDASQSMKQSDGIQSRWELALTAADKMLADLPTGSEAALLVATDDVKPLVPAPTTDHSILRKSLQRALPTDSSSEFSAAIARATAILGQQPERRGIITLFTDNQAVGWRKSSAVAGIMAQAGDRVTLRVHPIGGSPAPNLAVTAVKLNAAAAAGGQRLDCEGVVGNFSDTDALDVPVFISLDEQPPQGQKTIAKIAAHGSASIAFTVTLPADGYHTITISVQPDALSADDARSVAFRVLDTFRVLVVDGQGAASGVAGDSYFLRNSLAPVEPAALADYFVKITAVPASQTGTLRLDDYHLVVLANVPRLNGALATDLQPFLAGGGAALVLAGPDLDVADYNEKFGPLAGVKFGAVQTLAKPVGFQTKDYVHPLVAAWNDPAYGTFANVRFQKRLPMTVETSATIRPQVVLAYGDNSPALVETRMGEGRLWIFGSTGNTLWNNFPLRPAFVGLLSRMVTTVTGGKARELNPAVGQPFVFPVAAAWLNKEFSLLKPGQTGEPSFVGVIERSDRGPLLKSNPTDAAGSYAVFVKDAEEKPALRFAVQSDPEESDLAQVTPDRLKAFAITGEPAEGPADAVFPAKKGNPIDWFLALTLIALLVGIGESVFSRFCSEAR